MQDYSKGERDCVVMTGLGRKIDSREDRTQPEQALYAEEDEDAQCLPRFGGCVAAGRYGVKRGTLAALLRPSFEDGSKAS